jgi:hypothetical protein
LNVPSNYGFPPVTTTVKAQDGSNSSGSSGVFGVRPECVGQLFPQESIVIVPPQILLQMMRAEAREISSSTVRRYLGWAIRNRFNDPTFLSGQTTYYAVIVTYNQAAKDTGLINGQEPELSDAASVFNGYIDEVEGCHGFWSPTPDQ